MKHLKKFENFEKPPIFTVHGEKFTINLVYTGCYRIVHNTTRTWFLLKLIDFTDSEIETEAIKKINRVVKLNGGFPNFYPRGGDKFEVLSNKIDFITGSHWQNPGGTGGKTAYKGDILTFDREGEDNGFWYLDYGKKPESPWRYTDGTHREDLKGSKPWSLLWDEKIRRV